MIQVVIGPRQVGKSTAAAEIESLLGWPTQSATADDALPPGPEWIETHWQAARSLPGRRVLLVLDEIQKVVGWSGVVKRLWDEEAKTGGKVRVLLLGSSALLVQKGLTTTLAGYLQLLGTAFLVSGLELYSAGQGRKRGSSPKFVHWNNALVSALARRPFSQARADAAWWGRLVENAVGGWLLNSLSPTEWEVGYWRKANAEVDFVISRGREAVAIEVKSGRPGKPDGMAAFCRTYPRARPVIIGGGGLPLEEFFASSPERWLDQR